MDTYGFTVISKTHKYTVKGEDALNALGQGSYGKVYKASDELGETLAIKAIIKAHIDQEHYATELSAMYRVIQPVKGAIVSNVIYTIDDAEDAGYYYIMMPYFAGGSLDGFINKGLITSEIEAIEYFRQICYGMMVIHMHSVVHRDIKAANILISSYNDPSYPYKYIFSIGDLGESKVQNSLMTKMIGTMTTMAPEVLIGTYDARADVYSLGCVLFQMLTGRKPFTGATEMQINAAKAQQILSVGKSLSKLSMMLLEGCLQYDKENRLKPEELYDILSISTLYTDYKQIKLNELDESQRINMRVFQRRALKMEIPMKRQLKVATLHSTPTKLNAINSLATISMTSSHKNRKLVNLGTIQYQPAVSTKKFQIESPIQAHEYKQSSKILLQQLQPLREFKTVCPTNIYFCNQRAKLLQSQPKHEIRSLKPRQKESSMQVFVYSQSVKPLDQSNLLKAQQPIKLQPAVMLDTMIADNNAAAHQISSKEFALLKFKFAKDPINAPASNIEVSFDGKLETIKDQLIQLKAEFKSYFADATQLTNKEMYQMSVKYFNSKNTHKCNIMYYPGASSKCGYVQLMGLIIIKMTPVIVDVRLSEKDNKMALKLSCSKADANTIKKVVKKYMKCDNTLAYWEKFNGDAVTDVEKCYSIKPTNEIQYREISYVKLD